MNTAQILKGMLTVELNVNLSVFMMFGIPVIIFVR